MIDQIIFIGFLVLCIIFGLFSGRNITSVKDYAVGRGDFSTATIAATIIATYVSGSSFFFNLSRTYNEGLYYIWSIVFGVAILFLSLAYIFVPRMGEFLGKVSIADAMGGMFGKEVRIVTSIVGFLGAAGFVAMQLKVSGILFEQALGLPPIVGITIIGLIVTWYSTIGGIRAVTFTDVIQMFTFGTVIPIIIFFIVIPMEDYKAVFDIFQHNPKFNIKEVFDFNLPNSKKYLSLLLILAIPGFNPATFQRISMAKNIKQAKNSHIIACIVCVFVMILGCAISLLIMANNHNLQGNEVLQYIITHYSHVSLKGLVLVGVMAMVMSTIDSNINASSVLFVHDFCKPLNINLSNDELFATRITSLVIGSIAIILVLCLNDLITLFVLANTFFMPVLTPPFMLAIFGFRPHKYCVLSGMVAGIITTAIWEMTMSHTQIASLLPGMLSNLIFLVGSHYILKYFMNLPGGWVTIIPAEEAKIQTPQTSTLFDKIKAEIKEFREVRVKEFLEPHRLHDHLYFPLGLYCLSGTIFNVLTMPRELFDQYFYLKYVYFSLVFCSTVISMYPIWYFDNKHKLALSGLWYFSMFYMLVCVSTFLMLLTNLATSQVFFFVLNIFLLANITSWRVGLSMLIPGVYLAFKVYGLMDHGEIDLVLNNMQLNAIIIVSVTSTVLAFSKPKDDELELSNAKISHLANRVIVQAQELNQAINLKQQFINNITHEHHAPMTGIISTSQTLYESYHDLSEDDRKAAVKTIRDSAIKLLSLENNLELLQRLANPTLQLNITRFNLGRLINKCFYLCYKLYVPKEDEEKRDFFFTIPDNIYIEADADYLEHVINNLLINAINYCPFGKIKIRLAKERDNIIFSIIDNGIGIPQSELRNIFEKFVVSSRTHSKASGRGLGLAVCKQIIATHHGKIWAENNFNNTTFSFILPLTQPQNLIN